MAARMFTMIIMIMLIRHVSAGFITLIIPGIITILIIPTCITITTILITTGQVFIVPTFGGVLLKESVTVITADAGTTVGVGADMVVIRDGTPTPVIMAVGDITTVGVAMAGTTV